MNYYVKQKILERYIYIGYFTLFIGRPQIKGRGHNKAIKKMSQPCQNVSRLKFIQEMLTYNIMLKMHIYHHIYAYAQKRGLSSLLYMYMITSR